MSKNIKILLIKRAALGDILMSTPLIRQLKQKIPNLQLDFLCSKNFSGVLCQNQYIDNLITLKSELFSIKKIFGLIKFIKTLRNKYDYVFILDKHYYFNFIGRIISRNTVGYSRDYLSIFFLKHKVRYDNVMRYHSLYYLDLLKASGLAVPDYTDYNLDFLCEDTDANALGNILEQHQLSSNNFVIVINSGGNNQFESGGIRMLPEDKIISLLRLLSINTKVVLIGGLVDEINYNNYLKLVTRDNVINLAGKLSLKESGQLMLHASRVYTTDCGAMHIAISQKIFTNLYCFFGPSCPNHVLPAGRGIKYYWGDLNLFDKNYPLHGTNRKTGKYFTKLNLEKVLLDSEDEIKTLY